MPFLLIPNFFKAVKYWKALHKKCPYSELFWYAFIRMLENADQNNSEYGDFLRSKMFYFGYYVTLIYKLHHLSDEW